MKRILIAALLLAGTAVATPADAASIRSKACRDYGLIPILTEWRSAALAARKSGGGTPTEFFGDKSGYRFDGVAPPTCS
jgi:hypothetical protein